MSTQPKDEEEPVCSIRDPILFAELSDPDFAAEIVERQQAVARSRVDVTDRRPPPGYAKPID